MDTKWKKGKAIVSFLAFVIGLTVLVINLVPAVSMAMAFGMDIFHSGTPDYQESEEFRCLISEKLSDLLGVATGGQAYSPYQNEDAGGTAYSGSLNQPTTVAQEDAVVEESADYENAAFEDFMNNLEGPEAFGGNWDDYQAYLEEQQMHYDEMIAEYGIGSAYDDGYYYGYNDYYYGYGYGDEESRDAYMADMAKNKNLRYAVVCQNKLLYSNIEGFEEKAGEEWKGEDFSQALDGTAYNFTLWYNRENDGKVRIVKDGREENVYGDGVYREESRWRVPGYANFTIGESTQDTVIFLAAAKYPQLYLVREDGSSSTMQYGGRLCQMRQNTLNLYSAAERIAIFMSTALLLLVIAFLMRKSRQQVTARIAEFLGKICLEGKLFVLLVMVVFLAGMSAGAMGQLGWWLRNGLSWYSWGSDYLYEIAKLTRTGGYLALWLWLFYLVVLDFRGNRHRQKKPLFDLLKVKDFKYPIQKRLVRRQRITLIAQISLLTLFAVAICLLWLFTEEYMNYLTGGYSYSYTYDFYEEMAEDLGYPLALAGGHMVWILMPCVIFAALSGFTMMTFLGLKKNRRLAVDIGALTDQILAVREGNMTERLQLSEDTDLQEAADNLNEIQKGMETALAERVKSERMKVDLVTNVSHDIKTPLTSIISYVELLRQEEELPQYVKEYIQILGEKSERLRGIVQDVFEVSKATSGQLPINMETLDMGKLLRQTLADMDGQIAESTLIMKDSIPQEPVLVQADGQRLYRVFQNLLQNALRYSLPGSRIYLTLVDEAGEAVVRIKNTSSVELSGDKDFTERFVRGDESRTDGGSGLGLSIAKSFTEACGGRFSVETDADLFTVTVRFDRGGKPVTEVPFEMRQPRYNAETGAAMDEARAIMKGQIKAKHYSDAHTLFEELDAEQKHD